MEGAGCTDRAALSHLSTLAGGSTASTGWAPPSHLTSSQNHDQVIMLLVTKPAEGYQSCPRPEILLHLQDQGTTEPGGAEAAGAALCD